jgi:serine/threonine protein phosphatase PrpC
MIFTSIAARTDLGLIRQGNEDSALTHHRLIAVADGMGGAVGGEIASRIAIQTIAGIAKLLAAMDSDPESQSGILQDVAMRIDEEISHAIKEKPDLEGMGTTLTALAPIAQSVALLHIGDSRAYRLRDETLTQLSHDHTVVQELLDQGRIKPEDLEDHPQRSMLTQALMGRGVRSSQELEVEQSPLHLFPAKRDDIYLLCSDGLSSVLSDDEIRKILLTGNLEQAANNLIAVTRDGGAPDNVTVILAKLGPATSSQMCNQNDEISFLGAAHE